MLSTILKLPNLKLYAFAALAFLAMLFASYQFGVSSGHADGYKSGQESRQEEINKLITKIDVDAEAHNKRVKDLTIAADTAMTRLADYLLENEKQTPKIIYKYRDKNPLIINRVGFSLPTVETLNLLLDTQPVFDANGVVVNNSSNSESNKEGVP